MTIYAGETVQIFVEATDFDTSTVLSSADVEELVVTIYDSEEAITLAETAATYNATREGWELNWDTSAVAAGAYNARLEARGSGATPAVAIEFKKLRLRAQPVGG